MVADLEVWTKIIGAGLGVLVLILGAGKAWGTLTTELHGVRSDVGEIKSEVGEVGRKMSGLHDRFESYKTESRYAVAQLSAADSRLEGRVEVVERLQGLPPPWKRTQPITPAEDEG